MSAACACAYLHKQAGAVDGANELGDLLGAGRRQWHDERVEELLAAHLQTDRDGRTATPYAINIVV